eukprot:TRINITY_DN638_c0_g1_i8.p1 TRINITY_DN638_c0_g1~~TRINITY_DN638_c0_g1_i8.p1  ORF type:complete len:367 (-),score=92.63 TRINITY_DN638_c0_g1_i8:255-1355(-)
MLGAPPYRKLHYDSQVLSKRHPDRHEARVADNVSHGFGNISIPRLVDFLMNAASEDSNDLMDEAAQTAAADRRDALRILLSLICDLKSKATAITEGAIAPVGFMMEADRDDGVRSYAAQVLGSLLSVYQGRLMAESTGVVANLRKAMFDSSSAVRFEACRAILSLTDDIMGVNTVVENKLVVDIVAALDDVTPAVQEVALHALSNVLREEDSATEVALGKSLVSTLLKILKQGDLADDLVLYTTLCLQHVGNLREGKERILRDGAIPLLTLLLDHPYESVRAAAVGCMMVTSINVQAKAEMKDVALVRLGQLVLEDPDDTARHHATATLQHICELPAGRQALVDTFGHGEGRAVVALVLGDPTYFK